MERILARCLLLLVLCAGPADAESSEPGGMSILVKLADSAERIFRGSCLEAQDETLELAGGRIAVTRYTFTASEHLKGEASTSTVTFLQVGSTSGGALDLGRLAGLPVYRPGVEYVLFLLPESSAGLTSPSGAGEGAFVITGGSLQVIPGGHGLRLLPMAPETDSSLGAVRLSFDELKRALEEEL